MSETISFNLTMVIKKIGENHGKQSFELGHTKSKLIWNRFLGKASLRICPSRLIRKAFILLVLLFVKYRCIIVKWTKQEFCQMCYAIQHFFKINILFTVEPRQNTGQYGYVENIIYSAVSEYRTIYCTLNQMVIHHSTRKLLFKAYAFNPMSNLRIFVKKI